MWTDHIVYQNSGDLWCLILRNKADVISVPDFLFWALLDCSARAEDGVGDIIGAQPNRGPPVAAPRRSLRSGIGAQTSAVRAKSSRPIASVHDVVVTDLGHTPT